MKYFSYHATIKNLIKNGKLIKWEIVDKYNGISPALVLYFNDEKHPIMPIREKMFPVYFEILKITPF